MLRDLQINMSSVFTWQVCILWKEIAEITRDTEFKESEEPLIDIIDIKVHSCSVCDYKFMQNLDDSVWVPQQSHE